MAIAAPLVIPAAEALWAAIVFVGSALAAAAGITAAGEAIEQNFREKATTKVESCSRARPVPPPPDCGPIVSLIESRIAELRQRHAEMLTDKHQLYPIRPAAKPPFGSWPGHIKQYDDKQKNLLKLMKIAEQKGCPIPPGAEEWAIRPSPSRPVRASE